MRYAIDLKRWESIKMFDALYMITLETMKTVDYFLIPLSIVMFVLASLVLYFWMPIPREIKCSELISADKPASDYPYLAQGLLFAIGTIFFLIVTSVGEWK